MVRGVGYLVRGARLGSQVFWLRQLVAGCLRLGASEVSGVLCTKKKNSKVFPNAEEGRHFFENPHLPKLSIRDIELYDGILTEEELFKNLKKFGKNKAPGMDGLSCEFYLACWDEVKTLLLAVYIEGFDNGILHESLRSGLIILLEKKDQDKCLVANWRPITLFKCRLQTSHQNPNTEVEISYW